MESIIGIERDRQQIAAPINRLLRGIEHLA